MVSGDLGKLSFWVEWFLKTSLISDEIKNNLEVNGIGDFKQTADQLFKNLAWNFQKAF